MDDNHAQHIADQHEAGYQSKQKSSKSERMAQVIASLLAQAEEAAKRGDETAVQENLNKASALQLRFAIDDAQLPKGDAGKEEITYADFCREANTPLIKAKRELINSLAILNRGKAFLSGEYRKDANGNVLYTTHRGKYGPVYDKRAKMRVYAHESDLRFIEQMYTSLTLQMQTFMAADEKAEELDDKIMGGKGKVANAWRVSYAYGYVRRLHTRMAEAKRRAEQSAETGQPGTALVLVDRQALVEAEVARWAKLSKGGYRVDDDGSGTAAGREAANRADLGGTKVGGTRTRQISS